MAHPGTLRFVSCSALGTCDAQGRLESNTEECERLCVLVTNDFNQAFHDSDLTRHFAGDMGNNLFAKTGNVSQGCLGRLHEHLHFQLYVSLRLLKGD